MSLLREDLSSTVSDLIGARRSGQIRLDVGLPFLNEVVEGIGSYDVDTAPNGDPIIVIRVDLDLASIIEQLGKDGPVKLRNLNVSAMMAFCLGAMTMNSEGGV